MLIIFRRKRVSELAATHWPSKRPKFNTPEMKSELLQFATQIAPKCEMLEIQLGCHNGACEMLLQRTEKIWKTN